MTTAPARPPVVTLSITESVATDPIAPSQLAFWPLSRKLKPGAYAKLTDEQRRVLATLERLSRGEKIAWLVDLLYAARIAEVDETAFTRCVADLREAKVLDFVVAYVNGTALIVGPWSMRKRMHAAVVDLVRRAFAA